MKKFFKKVAIIAIAIFCLGKVSAQTAIQETKILDNVYVGAGVGVTTPLDFNSVFPLNTMFGVKAGKEITPVVGFELEGIAIFNDNHFGDFKTGVKATNLGGALTLNLSNLINGYPGKPWPIEFKTNTGIGWMHTYGDVRDALTAKTALDVVWNIGKSRALSVVVTPGIYWDLNRSDKPVWGTKFNKHNAQFSVMGTVVWHFKTSNGTRYFKKYDIGAMNAEVARLTAELEKKPKEVIVEKVVEKTVTVEKPIMVTGTSYVFFAQNSDVLTDDAKTMLNNIAAGTYNIDGYASPEGTDEYNQKLSERRANVVAEYLKNKNISIGSVKGHGVAFGDATNRMVKITKQ